MRVRMLPALAAAVIVAGCGDDGGAAAEGPVPAPPPPEYTEADMLRSAHLETNNSGLSYVHTPTGCQIAVVMMDAATVELYAGAGDTVASNPDRTIGVKLVGDAEDDQPCHPALTEALAGL